MRIPTNPMYDIDHNGVVRLISTDAIIPEYRNHRGRRSVKIRGKSHKPSSHPLDRLMLVTYKKIVLEKDTDWLSVRFKDNDQDNIAIDNLEWDDTWWYPNHLLGVEFGTTVWVPAYGCPEIDLRIREGIVLARCSRTHKEIGYKVYNGYAIVTVPRSQKMQRWHRLIALTFLPHPLDTDHLVVNHKDSDKMNNTVANLEWTTYTENNSHAYSEGPRSETVRKILLKNIATGEETLVAGYQEMSRVMGILPQAAHQAMERRKLEGRPYKGYVFKWSNDLRSWDELAQSGPRDTMRIPDKVAVRDMDTGDVRMYTSFRDLLVKENIRGFMVHRLLNEKVMTPWRRRCFQEVVMGKPLKWPHYPKHILDLYENISVSDKPIEVSDGHGNVRYYSSGTQWCEEDRANRCDPAVLSRYMKKNKGKPFRWRDWVFSHIDLSRYAPL